MNGALIVPVIIALVVVIAVVVVARARRSHDGVDSFRRQIDALSPEARRPVIDQVQNAAGRQPADDDAGDADDADDADDGGSDGT